MLLAFVSIALPVTASAEDSDSLSENPLFTSGSNDGKGLYVDGFKRPNYGSGSSTVAAENDSEEPVVEYVRGTECTRPGDWDYVPDCEGSVPLDFECPDGATPLDPLFSRTQNDDGSWTPWSMLTSYTCPDNTDAILAAVLHEWSTLTPTPTTALVQPDTGWVYANVPTVAMADDNSQIHSATLLGADVDIRATPANYTWSWGDGEHTETSDPGSPYPNATLTHTYSHHDGDVTLALETTWSGEYRIDGGAWVDFGTAITSNSPPITLEVRNPHSRLVACTTDGDCR
jgi:hypothetical protein